ncbi:MAG TPA: diguanylate cyclase [Armatimonadota bacterium]
MRIAWQQLRYALALIRRLMNFSAVVFLVVAAMTVSIFFLTHDSLEVCLLLVVPILLFSWVAGWWAGALAGLTATLLTAPIYGVEGAFISPPLPLAIWAYLSACYLLLGVLIGQQGVITRSQQARIYAEIEAKLQCAQASSKHYEALLEEMNEGHESLNRMNNELALLNTIATAVNSSLDLYHVQSTALAHISVLLNVSAAHFYWLDPEGKTFTLQCSQPSLPAEETAVALPAHVGVLGMVREQLQVVMLGEGHGDLALRPPTMRAATCCVMAVPLRARGRLVGALVLGRDHAQPFTHDDGVFLESVGRVLAVAVENANLFKQAQDLSLCDELTGLANRRLFNLRLAAEVTRVNASGDPLCLVLMDLDFFKGINDQYGHLAGDEVLRQFAQRVQAEVRGVDLLSRIGGEEFALVAINTPLPITKIISERILTRVAQQPFVLADGQRIALTVSAGIAAWSPTLETADALIAAADRALYQAKAAGRNCLHIDGHPDNLRAAS